MSNSNLERIENELKGLGYSPFCHDSPQGRRVIGIKYCITTGKYTGQSVSLGFSLQEENYPEYPPHWIHISPPYDDQLGGTTESYQLDNKKWRALSRPPQDIWDNLPTKHISHYLNLHISRFCKSLK